MQIIWKSNFNALVQLNVIQNKIIIISKLTKLALELHLSEKF